MAREVGQAPAIGATNTGIRKPYAAQNAAARANAGWDCGMIVVSFTREE
jgi:hypothetical protein